MPQNRSMKKTNRSMKKSKRVRDGENQAEPQPEKQTQSFGIWLRHQREARQILLRDIADESKISIRYLQALEEDRFEILPASVFATGFLRQYAGFVGLDQEEVVNFYLAARKELEGDEEEEEEEPRRNKRLGSRASGWVYAVVFLVVSALLIGLVWILPKLGAQQQQTPPDAVTVPLTGAPTPEETAASGAARAREAGVEEKSSTVSAADGSGAGVPAGAAADVSAGTPALETAAVPPPAAPAPPVAPLSVVLDFTGECWVEVRVDGRRQVSELRIQGESMQLSAQERVELTLGDAGAVEVEVNGRPFPLQAEPGQVVRGLRIDLATVRSLGAADEG